MNNVLSFVSVIIKGTKVEHTGCVRGRDEY